MQFVHMVTNAGKAIILENLNFCKTKLENELNFKNFVQILPEHKFVCFLK
jgi:hypothetical protein